MTVCPCCGVESTEVCCQSPADLDRQWSDGNRAFCDWLHRRKLRKIKIQPASYLNEPQQNVLSTCSGWGARQTTIFAP